MSSWYYRQASSLVRATLVLFILLLLSPAFSIAAQVTLAWDPNDPVPEGYRIYQRIENQAYDDTQPVWTGSGTTCTVDHLNDDTTYYFVVRAFDGDSESGSSNEITFLSSSPSATQFTISAAATDHGSITPSGSVIVDSGSNQIFTITPASGYRVADVLVDGTSVGPILSYQFDQVNEDHTIQVSFVADSYVTYVISATAGDNGTITPSGNTSVSSGGSQTYAIAPNSGCSITAVRVDGISVGSTTAYTFSNVNENHTIEASFAAGNIFPGADAGPDQTVDEGQAVTLSGLNSVDLDDGIAVFQWRQIQGVEVILDTPGNPETTFTAPNVDAAGTALVFELAVTDYSGATSVDTCIVNVSWVNIPPIANAGVDQIVNEGVQVALNASNSTDSDDGIASCLWKQLTGPVVTLSGHNSATPVFQAPDVGPEGDSMTFELTVTDAGGLQDTDTCLVVIEWVNIPPIADAGVDQHVDSGVEVMLDGSLSTDTDGDRVVSYRWRQTDGSPVVLSDTTAATPTFYAPDAGAEGSTLAFELTVTDSVGMLDMDTCLVHVEPSVITPEADTTPPTLTIDHPTDDPVTVSTFQIDLYGSAWDDQKVEVVTWENNRGGSGSATGTEQWVIENIRLRYGTNVITIKAVDVAGNSVEITRTVVVKFNWWWW